MTEMTEPRIEELVVLLTSLASGDLTARGIRSGAGDELDAVIEGINMLAEELEFSRDLLELRVAERTSELAGVNRDILRLTELGNLFQACENADEAFAVSSHGMESIFVGTSGGTYLYRSSRNLVELRGAWGESQLAPSMAPTACWALRRGSIHLVEDASTALWCPHVEEHTGASLCIPMSAHGETIGLLHLRGGGGLSEAKQQLARATSEQVSLALSNLQLRERLEVQALRDTLTGLHNRRFADAWLSGEISVAERSGRTIGVMMIDVDHFKQVNDVHGHEAGDELLKAVADTFRSSMRPEDMPCRYGGEEFLVMVPGIDLDDLQRRAEALRQRVSEIRVHHRGTTLPSVTVSSGVAVYPRHGETAAQLVQAADAALYEAKRSGRNQTRVAAET